MAKIAVIEPRLRERWGNLEEVIPSLVNVLGQEGTARRLGVTQIWVSRWLKDNGYVPVTQYVKHIPIESEKTLS